MEPALGPRHSGPGAGAPGGPPDPPPAPAGWPVGARGWLPRAQRPGLGLRGHAARPSTARDAPPMIRRHPGPGAPRRGPAAGAEDLLANHKSALKRVRQSERRRKRNQHIRSQMRTMVKRCREALEAGDASQAASAFQVAEREIRRAATKGVIPKQRADRSVGRLAQRLHSLTAAS